MRRRIDGPWERLATAGFSPVENEEVMSMLREIHGVLRNLLTMEDVKGVKDCIEVGEAMIVPVVPGSSAYKFEVGVVVEKSKHCFVVESLFHPSVRVAFQYVDTLLEGGTPVVSDLITGLSRGVRFFEAIGIDEALQVRDYMQVEGF